jgi:hypothetical protein
MVLYMQAKPGFPAAACCQAQVAAAQASSVAAGNGCSGESRQSTDTTTAPMGVTYTAAECVVRFEIAQHESAAMEEDHEGSAVCALIAGYKCGLVDANGQLASRAEDHLVHDPADRHTVADGPRPGDPRRGPGLRAGHRPNPRKRLVPLSDDCLRLGVHNYRLAILYAA